MHLLIRKVAEDDMDGLVSFHRQSFPVEYSNSFYTGVINYPRFSFVAHDGTTLVGCVCSRFDRINEVQYSLYLMTLAVAKNYRRRGIAKLLVLRVLQEAAAYKDCVSVDLHTQINNLAAYNLYLSLGFFCEGMKYEYYQLIDPPDAYKMRLDFTLTLRTELKMSSLNDEHLNQNFCLNDRWPSPSCDDTDGRIEQSPSSSVRPQNSINDRASSFPGKGTFTQNSLSKSQPM